MPAQAHWLFCSGLREGHDQLDRIRPIVVFASLGGLHVHSLASPPQECIFCQISSAVLSPGENSFEKSRACVGRRLMALNFVWRLKITSTFVSFL